MKLNLYQTDITCDYKFKMNLYEGLNFCVFILFESFWHVCPRNHKTQ